MPVVGGAEYEWRTGVVVQIGVGGSISADLNARLTAIENRLSKLDGGTGGGTPGGGGTTPVDETTGSTDIVLAFTSSNGGPAGVVNFTATASSINGTITSYTWDFGDGGETRTGASTFRVFTTKGPYTVKLTATDSAGKSRTLSKSVTVAVPGYDFGDDPYRPTAIVGIADGGDYRQSFTNSVSMQFTSDLCRPTRGATITQIEWTFSRGRKNEAGTWVFDTIEVTTEPNPKRTFSLQPGYQQYNAGLRVTDTLGNYMQVNRVLAFEWAQEPQFEYFPVTLKFNLSTEDYALLNSADGHTRMTIDPPQSGALPATPAPEANMPDLSTPGFSKFWRKAMTPGSFTIPFIVRRWTNSEYTVPGGGVTNAEDPAADLLRWHLRELSSLTISFDGGVQLKKDVTHQPDGGIFSFIVIYGGITATPRIPNTFGWTPPAVPLKSGDVFEYNINLDPTRYQPGFDAEHAQIFVEITPV